MFQKAVKSKSKLRLAIFGPSGAGKTFTSLRIATGIGGKIALIDSERKTASKYADRFDFDTVDLEKKTIEEYTQFISQAGKIGYNVLIIDSMSHAWQELLEEVDRLANAKYRGNTWSAWSEGTPKQKRFIDAILDFPGHVISTMRSKTEWTQEKDEKSGKSRPIKVGLAPEQGKGIEYEFDILMEMTVDHVAFISKDRTGKFQDEMILKPGEDFGKSLIEWLNSGAEAKPKTTPPPTQNGTTLPPSNGNGQNNSSQPTKPTPPPVQPNVQAKPRATQDQMARIKDLLREEEFLSGETIGMVNEYLRTHPNPSYDAAVNMLNKLEAEISENRQLISQDAGKPSFENLFGE